MHLFLISFIHKLQYMQGHQILNNKQFYLIYAIFYGLLIYRPKSNDSFMLKVDIAKNILISHKNLDSLKRLI